MDHDTQSESEGKKLYKILILYSRLDVKLSIEVTSTF